MGPISSTQPNPLQSENFGPMNQPKPQPNRTPYNRQQTLGALFHRNIMTVRTGDAPNCKVTKRTKFGGYYEFLNLLRI